MRPGHTPPQAPRACAKRRQQWAFHFNGIVYAGRSMAWRVVVIDDIDATDESDLRIHYGELAVHSTQTVALEGPGRNFRAIEQYLYASVDQATDKICWHFLAAEAIQHQAYRHTTCGS